MYVVFTTQEKYLPKKISWEGIYTIFISIVTFTVVWSPLYHFLWFRKIYFFANFGLLQNLWSGCHKTVVELLRGCGRPCTIFCGLR